jgi:hypothetical protein
MSRTREDLGALGRLTYVALGAWGAIVVGTAVVNSPVAIFVRLRIEEAVGLWGNDRLVEIAVAYATLALAFGGSSYALVRTVRWPWWVCAISGWGAITATVLVHRWSVGDPLTLGLNAASLWMLLTSFAGAWLARHLSSASVSTRRSLSSQTIPGLFLAAGLSLLAVNAVPAWSPYVRDTVQTFDIPIFAGGHVVVHKTGATEQLLRYTVAGRITPSPFGRFYLNELKSRGWEPVEPVDMSDRPFVKGGIVATWRDPRDMLRLVVSIEPGAVEGQGTAPTTVDIALRLREVSTS